MIFEVGIDKYLSTNAIARIGEKYKIQIQALKRYRDSTYLWIEIEDVIALLKIDVIKEELSTNHVIPHPYMHRRILFKQYLFVPEDWRLED